MLGQRREPICADLQAEAELLTDPPNQPENKDA
jgi:hypothetical protein